MRTIVPLSNAGLHDLSEGVARPGYRRSDVTPGILHFGVGNFHRSHQAAYLDDLMNSGQALDWGIVGAGVTSADSHMQRDLASQDFLTTLVEQDEAGSSARVIASMIDFVPPGDTHGLAARFADPRIRIVSLTITEGGYFIDATTGRFDAGHPSIRRDVLDVAEPTTVFGHLVQGLRVRRDTGSAPFTVMSCDNIPHNGKVTSDAVLQIAREIDAGLADWIATNVRFPNSMVDRITPATNDERRAWLRTNYGIADAAPVFCETFSQWVLEDDFSSGRPPLENAGVEFVADVTPFEIMKIRILNGGHAAIAYPAGLLGIEFVHDAMRHPLIAAYLEKLTREEIIPQTPRVPGTDLMAYRTEVARRFANPAVADTIRRLCFDGSNRQPKFIVPTIADSHRNGGPSDGLALVSALWCRYCLGRTEQDDPIAPNDPDWDRLSRTAASAQIDPAAWLGMRDIYGDVGLHPVFASAFAHALRTLATHGVSSTIERWLHGAFRP